jgi:hypothetical protein
VKPQTDYRRIVMIVLSALVLFATLMPAAWANPANRGVVPPQANPLGTSYGEWAARWWQWNYSMPRTTHPLSDPDHTAEDCAKGQAGQVWFLGGKNSTVPGMIPDTDRDCAVPSGTYFFFPVLNASCTDAFFYPRRTGSQLRDEAGLRATCTNFMNLAQNMSVEIDGVPVEGLGLDSQYRVSSDLFYVTLTDENLQNWPNQFTDTPNPAGVYGPIVTEGYYLMLAPLSVGQHTIRFYAEAAVNPLFVIDVTYRINVVPHGQFGR